MKKIICYKRGCNNRAQWTIPGKQVVHLCTKCMRELFPNQNIEPIPVTGPTEFKDGEEDDDGTT